MPSFRFHYLKLPTQILVALLKIHHHKLLLNALHCSTTAKTQHSKTRSPGKTRKVQNSALTFSHSSLSCWPCCRRTGAAAPPGCPECRHLWPAGKETGKARELKQGCKLWTLPAEQEPLCSAREYKPQCAQVEFCLLTRENWPLGWGSGRWQSLPAPSLANPWCNCEIQCSLLLRLSKAEIFRGGSEIDIHKLHTWTPH